MKIKNVEELIAVLKNLDKNVSAYSLFLFDLVSEILVKLNQVACKRF